MICEPNNSVVYSNYLLPDLAPASQNISDLDPTHNIFLSLIYFSVKSSRKYQFIVTDLFWIFDIKKHKKPIVSNVPFSDLGQIQHANKNSGSWEKFKNLEDSDSDTAIRSYALFNSKHCRVVSAGTWTAVIGRNTVVTWIKSLYFWLETSMAGVSQRIVRLLQNLLQILATETMLSRMWWHSPRFEFGIFPVSGALLIPKCAAARNGSTP